MSRAPAPTRARPDPTWRRAVAFLLLAGGGLGVLSLLDDEPPTARGGANTPARETALDTPPGVGILDDAGRLQTELILDHMEFDLSGEVEVAPGVFEERREYTVSFEEGRPGEGGLFELVEPGLTVYDPLTGAVTAEISALRGRCRTDQPGGGGGLQLQPDSLNADAFALEGDVRGYLLLEDGTRVDLTAEAIRQEGELFIAPGSVTLDRGDLRLEGLDLAVHRALGRLDLARDVVITFREVGEGLSGTLHGPGGLSWRTGTEQRAMQGHGELRGREGAPVTGDLDDGSRLRADLLTVDLDSSAVTLLGDAEVLMVTPEGAREARGRQLSLSRDEQGELAFAHAEGDVRIVIDDADGSRTIVEADSLTDLDGALVSSGPVRWRRGGATLAGVGLTFVADSGRVELDREVVVTVDEGHPSALAGLRLEADGGAEWDLPTDGSDPLSAARGLFDGPVRGRLPDGRRLACQRLEHDGPAGLFVLSGAASVVMPGETSDLGLAAARIELVPDETGALAELHAQRDVVLTDTPHGDDPPASLHCARLDVRDDRMHAPGQIVARRGSAALLGYDLTHDRTTGVLTIARDVLLTLDDGTQVRSPGGATWTLPDDSAGSASEGRGELIGPVEGERPDGSSFRAARATFDGVAERVSLLGAAEARVEGDRVLTSERIDLITAADGRRLESPLAVRFDSPRGRATGIGLVYDEADRSVLLREQPHVLLRDETGAVLLDVTADGLLRWDAPADPEAPWDMGHGRLTDGVNGRTADGMVFEGRTVEIDGSSGRVDLLEYGEASLPDDRGGHIELSADERITVIRDPRGGVVWIDALGSVDGTMSRPGDTLRVQADALVIDRETNATILDGESLFERVRERQRIVLSGDAGSRLVALTGDDGTLASLAGEGRLTSAIDSFRVISDRLDWDVPADYMVLSGNALVYRGPLTPRPSPTPKVEVWPDAWRWTVHPQIVTADGP